MCNPCPRTLLLPISPTVQPGTVLLGLIRVSCSCKAVAVFTRVPDIRKRLLKVGWLLTGPSERRSDERGPPTIHRILCPSCRDELGHNRSVTDGVEHPRHRENRIAAIEAISQERAIDKHRLPPLAKDAANRLT